MRGWSTPRGKLGRIGRPRHTQRRHCTRHMSSRCARWDSDSPATKDVTAYCKPFRKYNVYFARFVVIASAISSGLCFSQDCCSKRFSKSSRCSLRGSRSPATKDVTAYCKPFRKYNVYFARVVIAPIRFKGALQLLSNRSK